MNDIQLATQKTTALRFSCAFAAALTILTTAISARGGQIYVTNYNGSSNFMGPVGEYDSTTGATINATLVSGLSQSQGIAVSGVNLFVTDAGDGNPGHGTIREYNATTGA